MKNRISMHDLIEQLQRHRDWETGLIDPVDYDRFSCAELLAVIYGEATIEGLAWGLNDAGLLTEEVERAKLAQWERLATVANTSEG